MPVSRPLKSRVSRRRSLIQSVRDDVLARVGMFVESARDVVSVLSAVLAAYLRTRKFRIM